MKYVECSYTYTSNDLTLPYSLYNLLVINNILILILLVIMCENFFNYHSYYKTKHIAPQKEIMFLSTYFEINKMKTEGCFNMTMTTFRI